MGKYLSERPELDAEWKMDPSKCRNDLNMLVKDAPRCCTYQRSVLLRVLATAQIQPCPPHNPFLCCTLLVTCKDSVSAALRELSAVLHGITAAARCICCSHISDAISPPRSRGAHEINARLSSRICCLYVAPADLSFSCLLHLHFPQE